MGKGAEEMKAKRKSTRIHCRKIDRGVARKRLRDEHVSLSKRHHKYKSFANIWRELSQ